MMRGRRSGDTVIAQELLDLDFETSDESYKAPSDEEQYTEPKSGERRHYKKKKAFDQSELHCFSSILSAAGNPASSVSRLKQTLQNNHPFLQRSDSYFDVEWCDTLKKFFYTDAFTGTLHEMESSSARQENQETFNGDAETKDIGFSLAVDFSRFRSPDDTDHGESKEVTPLSHDEEEESRSTAGSKMNTAEAALLTWKSLKAANPDMAKELQSHYKGKNVYLDEKNFLQQANEKQDELRLQMEMESKRHQM